MPPPDPQQGELDARCFALSELGYTTAEIANQVGKTRRTVQRWILRARNTPMAEWKEFANRIRVVMNGVVGACVHGLPTITIDGETIWVCADCTVTNRPNHPAFRQDKNARLEKPKKPPKFQPKIKTAKRG